MIVLKSTKTAHKAYLFALTVFSLEMFFNGVYNFFVSLPVRMLMDLSLLLLMILPDKIKINYKAVCLMAFSLLLTFLFLLLYYNDNHFGIQNLILNAIATGFYVLFFMLLYFKASVYPIGKYVKFILSFFLLVNIVLFGLYLLYNKTNGLLGKTSVQIIIFQDWTGRFQGTFSEPSILGFYLGCMFFIVMLAYRGKWKYGLALLILYMIYFANQAKFVLIGLPAAVFVTMITSKISIHDHKPFMFAVICVVCVAALNIDNVMQVFYSGLSDVLGNKEKSGTFVTRFSFIFAAIKNLCKYPLGTGFGMNYEYFYDTIPEIVSIANAHNLDTSEIQGYLTSKRNFGSKETFSFAVSSLGFIGLYLLSKYFCILYNRRYYRAFVCKALVLFIFLEIIFSMNMFIGAGMLSIIYSRMAINGYRKF